MAKDLRVNIFHDGWSDNLVIVPKRRILKENGEIVTVYINNRLEEKVATEWGQPADLIKVGEDGIQMLALLYKELLKFNKFVELVNPPTQAVDATKKHLEDMRVLAFLQLNCDMPEDKKR